MQPGPDLIRGVRAMEPAVNGHTVPAPTTPAHDLVQDAMTTEALLLLRRLIERPRDELTEQDRGVLQCFTLEQREEITRVLEERRRVFTMLTFLIFFCATVLAAILLEFAVAGGAMAVRALT